jgi:polar amino acid transport system substrate-binding protein
MNESHAKRLALCVLPTVCLAAQVAAAPLNLCFEDVPQAPWTMPDGAGLNIELLKRVARLTGEQFNYIARPWKRCEEETRSGVMDGMIGPSDNPRRRAYSLPPLKPDGTQDPERAMYHDHVGLFLRAGSGASWDGKSLVNPRGYVVAQRGYYTVDMLQALGQKVIDTPKSAEEGLRLLAAGAADVAVLMGRSAEESLRGDPRFHGHIVLARQPFATFDFHLMISRKSFDKDPRRFEAIWNAIATVRATPEYRRLEAAQMRRPERAEREQRSAVSVPQ